MRYAIIPRARSDEPIYMRTLAAQLAHVSLDFLQACEQEGLIEVQLMTGGGFGLDANNIRRLVIIRRLCRDLELDLETVELVLHLRRQVLELQMQVEQLERRARQRKQKLHREIHRLRRLLAQEP
jgi:DNA-binding transcriptional MerR regulator